MDCATEALVIANPHAGRGRVERELDDGLRWLRCIGWQLDTRWSQAPGHASILAREGWQRGLRTFISAGGGGTAHEIINGLIQASTEEPDTHPPRLALLPLGRHNDWLSNRQLGSTDRALQTILAGHHQPLPLMQLEHSTGILHALNSVLIGPACRWLSPGSEFMRWRWLLQPSFSPLPCYGEGIQPDPRPAALLACITGRRTLGQHLHPAVPPDGKMAITRLGLPDWRQLSALSMRLLLQHHLPDHHPELRYHHSATLNLSDCSYLDLLVDGEARRLQPRHLKLRTDLIEVML